MAKFDGIIRTIEAKIKEFGGPVSLIRRSAGAYDPATGTTAAATVETWNGYGILVDYTLKQRYGTAIQEADRNMLMAAKDINTDPKAGDFITWMGVEYQVVSAQLQAPNGQRLIFDLQVRSGS